MKAASSSLRLERGADVARVTRVPPVTRAARAVAAPADAGRTDAGTDAGLMRALSTGALGPLGELYDRYHDDVRQFARRACSRPADVDDVVHDTFLTAARAAGSYDGRPCARPFLVGIAAQLVRQRRRVWARWAEVMEQFVSSQPAAAPHTPEDDAQAAEKAAHVERALGRLTEEKRLVLLLFEREGLSGEEVARALDIPVGTVWTRLHHARADMRRALKGRNE
jgi:RNA polymerase sigma factor (sigma-70 family)